MNKIRNISYATIGFSDRPVEKALDAIAEAGFPQVELLGQEPHLALPPTGQELSDFRTRLEARQLITRTVHAPAKRNVLGAPEENWRAQVIQTLASYLRFAGAIGAGDVIIHPIPNPIFVPDAKDPAIPGRIQKALSLSLDELVLVAQETNTRILLENLPYFCDYPYRTMKELRPLVNAYPAEQLGLVIDTGHAWTLKVDPAGEIQTAGSRLKGTHLQDVDYDEPNDNHWMPTRGGLDWTAIRQALAAADYSGPWTFEVARSPTDETPDELARATAQLAASWGL